MRNWYDIIPPHGDIRKGHFDEAVFAADLGDVAAQAAPQDSRWSDSVPIGAQLGGVCVAVVGFGLTAWSIRVNRFFAKAVRIQEDRKQRVVTGGPYRWIRHPGYCGFALIFLASSIALGSWLSCVPSLGMVVFFVWRTAVEDRFLQAHLEGYAEYAQRVRYRLMPGVW